MRFRQFGILMMIGGFLGGHLLSTLATRSGMQAMHLAGGNANPSDLASASASALGFMIYGDLIALLGLVLYFYGVLTSHSGTKTTIVG